jgi:dCTP deaminase
MILSDQCILRALEERGLAVEPLELGHVGPSSFDVRLGVDLQRFPRNGDWDSEELETVWCPRSKRYIGVLDPLNPKSFPTMVQNRISREAPYILMPNEFILGTTLERVVIPADLCALVDGRSSYGRLGLLVHATAGFIDAGFEGQITLEIKNLNDHAIKLYPGERLGQLLFFQQTSPSQVPYGQRPGSKYQGQTGTTASRVCLDTEK